MSKEKIVKVRQLNERAQETKTVNGSNGACLGAASSRNDLGGNRGASRVAQIDAAVNMKNMNSRRKN